MWIPQDTQPGQAGLDHTKAYTGVDPLDLQHMQRVSMEALNGFRLKQKTGVEPALSCFEFRAEGDFSPFVLFGGGREKHL